MVSIFPGLGLEPKGLERQPVFILVLVSKNCFGLDLGLGLEASGLDCNPDLNATFECYLRVFQFQLAVDELKTIPALQNSADCIFYQSLAAYLTCSLLVKCCSPSSEVVVGHLVTRGSWVTIPVLAPSFNGPKKLITRSCRIE